MIKLGEGGDILIKWWSWSHGIWLGGFPVPAEGVVGSKMSLRHLSIGHQGDGKRPTFYNTPSLASGLDWRKTGLLSQSVSQIFLLLCNVPDQQNKMIEYLYVSIGSTKSAWQPPLVSAKSHNLVQTRQYTTIPRSPIPARTLQGICA